MDWSSVIGFSPDDSVRYRATVVTRSAESIAAKNGTTADEIKALNPDLIWPVNPGTMVKVR